MISWFQVKEYIPPFYMEDDGTSLVLTTTKGHDILALVYKQRNGRVRWNISFILFICFLICSLQVDMADEIQNTCDPTILGARIGDHVTLAETYNLELVAGNFFFTTYTEATNTLLCYFTKCSGQPFPVPAPGINDGPECSKETKSFAQNVNLGSLTL